MSAIHLPSIRELYKARYPIVNGWLCVPGGFGAELAARSGYDSITIDMQHGMLGFPDVLMMLQCIGTVGTPTLVRVPSAFDHVKADVMMQVLDAGAGGIIAPQMDTPEIAAQIVAACKYPPAGKRSFGPIRAAHVNPQAETLAFGMIESAEALAQLDAILDTPGLDGIYIGPNDLSIALGVQPASEPSDERIVATIERIRVAAQARGLMAGIFCSDGQACARRLAEGFDMATPGADASILINAHKAQLLNARASNQAR